MIDPLCLSTPSGPTGPTPQALPVRKLLTPSPTHPDDYILELSASSLGEFTLCQRKAEYEYVLSRVSAERSEAALRFGSLFHECEALRLLHGLSPAVVLRQQELCAKFDVDFPVGPDEHRTGARMRSVLAKYNALNEQDMWPERVLKVDGEKLVERSFKIELCTIPVETHLPYPYSRIVADPHTTIHDTETWFCRNLHVIYCGIIDAALTDGNFLFVVDHKTSKQGGAEFWEGFNLSTQTVGYAWGLQKILGPSYPVHGAQINALIIRPESTTGRAKLPREEFDRKPFFYPPERLVEWEESTKHIVADMVSSLVRGYFPLTGPKSFKSPCPWCDYHDVCRLEPRARGPLLASGQFKDRTVSAFAQE